MFVLVHKVIFYSNMLECAPGNKYYSWNKNRCLPDLPAPVGLCLPNENYVTDCECPSGYALNITSRKCVSCYVSNCKKCDFGSSRCLECEDKYSVYSYTSYDVCLIRCHFSCKSCYYSNDYASCYSCNNGYFLFQYTCSTTCPNGYFGNKNLNLCDKCDNSCIRGQSLLHHIKQVLLYHRRS